MKKKVTKLVLAKETVRNLGDPEVAKAQGGASYISNCCDTLHEDEWLSVNPTC